MIWPPSAGGSSDKLPGRAMACFPRMALALLLGGVAILRAAEDLPYVIYETRGKYADVLDDVRQAIIGRGLVIGTSSQVKEMLERTGKDLGINRPIYDNGEVLQFCSAVLSRKSMELDPRNIVYCPSGIAVWTEAGKPDRVFVGYRRNEQRGTGASAAALRDVDKLLDDIAREAVR
jgi:uncharacterized protein (DUF302 family)